MVYDDVNKKWVPAGSSNGFAKVHIYHHVVNNTYRVVGRKLQDQEVSRDVMVRGGGLCAADRRRHATDLPGSGGSARGAARNGRAAG